MLSQQDLKQLAQKGISEAQIEIPEVGGRRSYRQGHRSSF